MPRNPSCYAPGNHQPRPGDLHRSFRRPQPRTRRARGSPSGFRRHRCGAEREAPGRSGGGVGRRSDRRRDPAPLLSSRARGRGAAIAARCDDADVRSRREHQADRALVAAYHEARLGELVEHVAAAVERFRADEHDAFAVDEILHQYQRAARELWKFCWLAGAGVERTARLLRDMAAQGESVDWWQLGAPARSRRSAGVRRDWISVSTRNASRESDVAVSAIWRGDWLQPPGSCPGKMS